MVKSNLKITFRNLWKNKIFSMVNISGLTIGIIYSLLLIMYTKYELSSDRYFKHSSLSPVIGVNGRSSLFPRQFLETCNPELSLRVRYIINNNYQTHSKKY